MAITAGIDEAGYGPPLGPLVVAASAFRIPDPWVGRSLFAELEDTVSQSVRDARGRVVVADSKKVYRGKGRTLRRLEHTVLSFLEAARGAPARNFNDLLTHVSLGPPTELDRQPWFKNRDMTLPVDCDAEAIARQAGYIRRELDARGVRFLGTRARILPAGAFNRMLARRGVNKADVLSRLNADLLRELWTRFPALHVTADKHGARKSYGRFLYLSFKGVKIRGFEEEKEVSAYRLEDGPRSMDLFFVEKAEGKALAVALSSMVAKYLRELCMRLFNRFGSDHVQGVQPTAGYPTDAVRFLKDIAPARGRLGIADSLLIRAR